MNLLSGNLDRIDSISHLSTSRKEKNNTIPILETAFKVASDGTGFFFHFRMRLLYILVRWFGEINRDIRHHDQYRSMNFPRANMMLDQGDFYARQVMRVGSVF